MEKFARRQLKVRSRTLDFYVNFICTSSGRIVAFFTLRLMAGRLSPSPSFYRARRDDLADSIEATPSKHRQKVGGSPISVALRQRMGIEPSLLFGFFSVS